jgi:hypothetical protein
MGALFVSIEKITYLTTRCTIYETLYNPGTTPETALNNLYEALVKLYATMLQVMALAHRLHAKRTVARAMHALINPSELSDLLAKCHDLESRLEVEAQNCERVCNQRVDTKTHELLEGMWKPILRTDKAVSSFLEKLNDSERLKILDWISDVPFGNHHATVNDKRTKDTCEWLLTHSQYQEWYDTSSSAILWLHGTRRLFTILNIGNSALMLCLIVELGKRT